MPYDSRTAEQILSTTRGNSKIVLTANGKRAEVWKFSRDDVQDLLGVGWKVEGDDDVSANALALIWPVKMLGTPIHAEALSGGLPTEIA
jgi:hypothetical protein